MIQAGDIHFTVKTPVGVTKITISSIQHNFFSNSQRILTKNFLHNKKGFFPSRFPNPNGYISQISRLPCFWRKKSNFRANLVNGLNSTVKLSIKQFSIKFPVFWRSLSTRGLKASSTFNAKSFICLHTTNNWSCLGGWADEEKKNRGRGTLGSGTYTEEVE